MRVTDDDLKDLLPERPGSRQACPPPEALGAAAAGALPDAEREAVIEHVARCRECAEEVRLVAPLGPWAEAAAAQLQPRAVPVAAPARAWWRPWPVWAAAAVALLALPFVVRLQRDSTPAAMRAQEGTAIRSLLPEAAPVPRARCLLRWTDLGPGARYSVSVLTKDLRPLASADGLERPEYAVAPDALGTVPSGSEIVWSVEARWPDGRRRASPMFVTRLD
jgi:Putative zinc-finger